MFDNALYVRAVKSILDSLFRSIRTPLCDYLLERGFTQMSSPCDLCAAVCDFDELAKLPKTISSSSPVLCVAEIVCVPEETICITSACLPEPECCTVSVHCEEKDCAVVCLDNDTTTFYLPPPQTVTIDVCVCEQSDVHDISVHDVEIAPVVFDTVAKCERPRVLTSIVGQSLPSYVASTMCNMLAKCDCSVPGTLCEALHDTPLRIELLKLRSFRNFVKNATSCELDGVDWATCPKCSHSILHDEVTIQKRGGLCGRRFRRKSWNVRPRFVVMHACPYQPTDDDERLVIVRSAYLYSICVVPSYSCAKAVFVETSFRTFYVAGVVFDSG